MSWVTSSVHTGGLTKMLAEVMECPEGYLLFPQNNSSGETSTVQARGRASSKHKGPPAADRAVPFRSVFHLRIPAARTGVQLRPCLSRQGFRQSGLSKEFSNSPLSQKDWCGENLTVSIKPMGPPPHPTNLLGTQNWCWAHLLCSPV